MRKETYYSVVATYDNVADIRCLAGRTADEMIAYFKSGKGTPQTHVVTDRESDVILEEEAENIKTGYTKVTSDGQYLISDGTYNIDVKSESGVSAYIDIYEFFLSRYVPDVFAAGDTLACELPDGRFLFRDDTFTMSVRKKTEEGYRTIEKGIVGGIMMREEDEFLSCAMWYVNERFRLPKEDKYNDEVCRMVASCHREMMEMTKRFGVSRIDFSLHPDIEPVSARFDDEQGHSGYEDVRGLVFDHANDYIKIRSEHFQAYTDGTYGDFFNVADKLPLLYQAMVRILQEYDIKPEERTV